MKGFTMRSVLLLPLLAALTLAANACSGSSTSSTTSPSATASQSTETFTGSIGQNGSAVYSFTVGSAGYSVVAGYTSIAPSTVTSLGMGIGVWNAASSTCSLNQTQNDVAKSGSTAISGTADAGSYCIRVYDGGNITSGVTASYTLQVEHY